MTDVKTCRGQAPTAPFYLRDEALKQGAELLFFASRDVSTAGSGALEEARLGRAHRRALYFIARNPGLTVADLLSILRVTKQSLNRVLNDLLDGGYVERKPAMRDRRRRELSLTEKGAALENAIWDEQRARIVRAFREAGPDAVTGFRRVLTELMR
jgi:DNA-binding MarR family transcriptional regulator